MFIFISSILFHKKTLMRFRKQIEWTAYCSKQISLWQSTFMNILIASCQFILQNAKFAKSQAEHMLTNLILKTIIRHRNVDKVLQVF